MIYTVTFNPSLDYVIYVRSFVQGAVNRTARERIFAGGKGINVSVMLKRLGVKSQALGFAAGFTGEQLLRELHRVGCETDFVLLSHGLTRMNLKIKADVETEINAQGPQIDEAALTAFFQKLDSLAAGDFLVLAGSVPSSLPNTIYQEIMAHLESRGIQFVVDAQAELLLNVLPYRPLLIKPNHYELAEMFQAELHSEADLIFYGKKLRQMGARNVLISRAEKGALLLTEDDAIYRMSAPKGQVVHSTGAGDSMIAGFLACYAAGRSLLDAFCMAVAAGSATAFSEGLAERAEVERIYGILTERAADEIAHHGFAEGAGD